MTFYDTSIFMIKIIFYDKLKLIGDDDEAWVVAGLLLVCIK